MDMQPYLLQTELRHESNLWHVDLWHVQNHSQQDLQAWTVPRICKESFTMQKIFPQAACIALLSFQTTEAFVP